MLANLLAESGQPLSELVRPLLRYAKSPEINSEVADPGAPARSVPRPRPSGCDRPGDGRHGVGPGLDRLQQLAAPRAHGAFQRVSLDKTFTIDARVDSITEEKARLLKKLNIATVKLFSHSQREAGYARSAMQEFLATVYRQMRLVSGFEIVNQFLSVLLIASTAGMVLTATAPEINRHAKYSTMIGPKIPATRSVPLDWKQKRTMAMVAAKNAVSTPTTAITWDASGACT